MTKEVIKRDILILIPIFYIFYLCMVDIEKISQIIHFLLEWNLGEAFEEIFYSTLIIPVILGCLSVYFFTRKKSEYPPQTNYNRRAGVFLILLILVVLFFSSGLFYILMISDATNFLFGR